MKIWILLLVLMNSAMASIPTEGQNVLPFQKKSYPLKELVKDYAEALKISVFYLKQTFENDKSTVNLYIHDRTSFAHFATLVKSILDSHGYLILQEKGFQWISRSREIRFLPTQFYADQSYPNDAGFVTTLTKTKYPIAAEITRNLRPFLSRYGRVINFEDGRTIMLMEKGDNAHRIDEAIKFMDREEVYQVELNKKPREISPEENPKNQKIVELEMRNKILEKKLQDLMNEASPNGMMNPPMGAGVIK